jgi:hypothetical protein
MLCFGDRENYSAAGRTILPEAGCTTAPLPSISSAKKGALTSGRGMVLPAAGDFTESESSGSPVSALFFF